MSNGAEQFLGRQLVNMTQALQGLVTDNVEMLIAIQNMKDALLQTIPKFAIKSENLKISKAINRSFNDQNMTQLLTSQLNGSIRVKITVWGNSTGIVVYNNGTQITVVTGITGTESTKTIDINILEGDVISVKCASGGTTNYISTVTIHYDLAEKPTIII